jgi:hypothetical protein
MSWVTVINLPRHFLTEGCAGTAANRQQMRRQLTPLLRGQFRHRRLDLGETHTRNLGETTDGVNLNAKND